ncbi:hypothetical protein M758_12G165500 [Ceratodon purpureus]|nr:hypothetical protein M758_12G165500 [Ceratodon purpureus]
MDHLGSSSAGGNQYSQGEPFFDLLQPTTTSSGYHGAQNSPPVYFANDDVLPNMDFQPMVDAVGKGKADDSMRGWQSQSANSRNLAPAYDLNVRPDKDAVETATVAAVERTMKKYADNLLRVLEGIGGRLAQLEANSSRMEHSVDKIKVEAADNFGATDGKLRSLENMIREVQRSVQVIRDKQEIAEEQMKLEKLQLSAKRENPAPVVSTPTVETKEAPLALPAPTSVVNAVEVPPAQAAPVVQQQPQQVQPSAHQLSQPSQQVLPPHQQLPTQLPSQHQVIPLQHQQLQMQGPAPQHQHLHLQGQVAPSQHQQLQAQGQNPALPQQQMQMQGMMPLPQQQLQLQGPPQASQLPPQSSQVQPPHLQQQHQQLQLQAPNEAQYQSQQASSVAPPHSSQMQPFYGQQQQQGQPGPAPAVSQQMYGNLNQEVNPYGASQGSYNQELPPPQVPGGYELRFLPLPAPPPPPSMGQMQQAPTSQHQQLGQGGSQMFDSPRSGGGPPALAAGPYHPQAHPPQGRDSPQAYNQYAPQYRMAQPASPASAPQGGGYQQLPTARPVQPSLGSQGGPGPVANRVPVEEVIDKVAGMGFGRDQVRAVVRRLTENGTSVDLNVVLDKLMNGDSSSRNEGQQPAKGWYGR